MTYEEAAALAGVTASAVNKWAYAGHVDRQKIGKRVFVTRVSVEKFVEGRKPRKGGRRKATSKRAARIVIERNLVQVDTLMAEVRREMGRLEKEVRAEAAEGLRKQVEKALR
jgi:hypothetical protein